MGQVHISCLSNRDPVPSHLPDDKSEAFSIACLSRDGCVNNNSLEGHDDPMLLDRRMSHKLGGGIPASLFRGPKQHNPHSSSASSSTSAPPPIADEPVGSVGSDVAVPTYGEVPSRRIVELETAVLNLKGENEHLWRAREDLESDNRRLRRTLQDMECQKAWRTFDVVERHYKQLERHRQRRENDACDVDSAPTEHGSEEEVVSNASSSPARGRREDVVMAAAGAPTMTLQPRMRSVGGGGRRPAAPRTPRTLPSRRSTPLTPEAKPEDMPVGRYPTVALRGRSHSVPVGPSPWELPAEMWKDPTNSAVGTEDSSNLKLSRNGAGEHTSLPHRGRPDYSSMVTEAEDTDGISSTEGTDEDQSQLEGLPMLQIVDPVEERLAWGHIPSLSLSETARSADSES